MLLLIVCMLLSLSIILVGSPSWRNPPVGIGMLIAAGVAAYCIYKMISGHGALADRTWRAMNAAKQHLEECIQALMEAAGNAPNVQASVSDDWRETAKHADTCAKLCEEVVAAAQAVLDKSIEHLHQLKAKHKWNDEWLNEAVRAKRRRMSRWY